MSAFLDFFRLMVVLNVAIGVINASGFFDTQYMTQSESLTYDLIQTNASANSTQAGELDYFTSSITLFWTGLGFIKDFAIGAFATYWWLKDNFNAPDALAIPLQTIVAISWFMFFAQIIMRGSWKGYE